MSLTKLKFPLSPRKKFSAQATTDQPTGENGFVTFPIDYSRIRSRLPFESLEVESLWK
jgi:hypothetical protein